MMIESWVKDEMQSIQDPIPIEVSALDLLVNCKAAI